MAYTLSNKCAKNLCKRIVLLQLIIKNVVTCFLEQCISATDEANNFKFGVQLGLESSLPRNNFYDQNWRGSGLGEYPKKFGTPIYF